MDDCDKTDSLNEEFYDACSDQLEITPFEMDLNTALKEAEMAIHYFFNNQFEQARELLKPFSESSLYHSMGIAVFSFLEAMLTFEHINEASVELKKCLEICQRLRKKSSITEFIGRTFRRENLNNFSDLECHAELCTAEALLMSALLTFIEDENLTGLIRGSLQVRQCFNCFRLCARITKYRQWSLSSMSLKNHFASGVHMGIGTFNIMISMLPVRITSLLKLIGLSSNRVAGLNELHSGYQENGLRQVLCALSLLCYHLMIVPMLSHQHFNSDLNQCDKILTTQMIKYPNGVWMLFFKGRYELCNGNFDAAESWFLRSWKSQDAWPQFHHLSFWELLWLNSMQRKWSRAHFYAKQLLEKSNWSRSIYAYQLAAIKLMSSPSTVGDFKEINALMLQVPACRQKIAGKSLPMEKFIAKRADRYMKHHQLILPIIELMYLWNMLQFMAKDYLLAEGFLHIIDAELALLNKANLYYADNRALCLLLRGSCYVQMDKTSLALEDFNECIAQTGILEDSYIMPYAYVEAALCHASENRFLAISMLENTKKKYPKFAMESRLHFRIHAALIDLKCDNA